MFYKVCGGSKPSLAEGQLVSSGSVKMGTLILGGHGLIFLSRSVKMGTLLLGVHGAIFSSGSV